jgi:F0F1-type ATP synthase assembly protein I
MVGFTLLGLGVDYLAGLTPWFTVAGTLLGLVVAMIHLVRMANSAAARKPESPPGADGS